jgi:hypothetical protein
MAFAATLLQRVQDGEDGYRRLDRYLRHVDVRPGFGDFLYRINRRRDSGTGIDGLAINRLSTWSVIQVITQVSTQTIDERRTAARDVASYMAVELDVNTIQEYPDPLPHDRLPDIIISLMDAATDIAATGDVSYEHP